MKKKGYITVIIPVYNVEKYIHRCMESVIGQTYKKLEIILVDDGSKDSSGDICDEYARQDDRIKVIHKNNGGLSSARNVALDIAQGEYIGFVDSDDYISCDMFEKLYYTCEEKNSDIAICCHYTERGEKLLIEDPIVDEEQQFTNIQALDILIKDEGMKNYAWDKLYRACLFDGIRYPEGRNYEDIATTYLLFYRANRLCRIPQYLYYYQIREGSISSHRQDEKWYENCYQIVESQIDRYRFMQEKGEQYLAQLCLAQMVPYLYEYIRLGIKIHKFEHYNEVVHFLNKEKKEIFNNMLLNHKDKKLLQIYTAAPSIVRVYMQIKPMIKKGQYIIAKALERIEITSTCNYDFSLKEGKEKSLIFFELPCFDNLGDHAIAYAQTLFLQTFIKKHAKYQLYVIDGWDTIQALIQLKKEISKQDVILCQGGGNMGNLYEFAEAFRKKIIDYFPHNRIIIFPQTIFFSGDEQNNKKLQISKVYNRCDKLTICARDHISYEMMQKMFNARIVEVNDIVAYLSGKVGKAVQRKGILLCLRSDGESALSAADKRRIQNFCFRQSSNVKITDTCTGKNIERDEREKYLNRKWNLFMSAEIVVTDRLHGMIFSLITGTSCIVLGNNHHKVKATYETFKDCEYLYYAENIEDIENLIASEYDKKTNNYIYDINGRYNQLEELIVQ